MADQCDSLVAETRPRVAGVFFGGAWDRRCVTTIRRERELPSADAAIPKLSARTRYGARVNLIAIKWPLQKRSHFKGPLLETQDRSTRTVAWVVKRDSKNCHVVPGTLCQARPRKSFDSWKPPFRRRQLLSCEVTDTQRQHRAQGPYQAAPFSDGSGRVARLHRRTDILSVAHRGVMACRQIMRQPHRATETTAVVTLLSITSSASTHLTSEAMPRVITAIPQDLVSAPSGSITFRQSELTKAVDPTPHAAPKVLPKAFTTQEDSAVFASD
jgi:hypothetical protein